MRSPPDYSDLPPLTPAADKQIVTWWLAFLLAQDPRSQADRIRAAMASSLEQQRLSVLRQTASATPAAPLSDPACDPIPQPELAGLIDNAAHKHSLDPSLILEVARQESGFHPCAVSLKGAQGLMQLMPSTQIQFQVTDPFSAKESLEAGAKLLKQLLDRYHGDLSMALSAYNAGSATVDRAGKIPDIPETKRYVENILTRIPLP